MIEDSAKLKIKQKAKSNLQFKIQYNKRILMLVNFLFTHAVKKKQASFTHDTECPIAQQKKTSLQDGKVCYIIIIDQGDYHKSKKKMFLIYSNVIFFYIFWKILNLCL